MIDQLKLNPEDIYLGSASINSRMDQNKTHCFQIPNENMFYLNFSDGTFKNTPIVKSFERFQLHAVNSPNQMFWRKILGFMRIGLKNVDKHVSPQTDRSVV